MRRDFLHSDFTYLCFSESRQQPDKWRSNSQPQSVLRVNNRESNFKPYEDRAFLSLRNSGTGALPLPIPDPRPKYEDIETPFQIRSAFPTDHLTHQLSSFSQAGPMVSRPILPFNTKHKDISV